jgi:hypothetical protein
VVYICYTNNSYLHSTSNITGLINVKGHFQDDNLVSKACRFGKDFGQWNNIPLCLMVLFILIRSKNIYTVYIYISVQCI